MDINNINIDIDNNMEHILDIKEENISNNYIKNIINYCENIINVLGPGLTEHIYHRALYQELISNNYNVDYKRIINIFYNNKNVGYVECDLLIEINDKECLIIELKTIQRISKKEISQTKMYLKHIEKYEKKIGLIINFPVNYEDTKLYKVEYKQINLP